MGIGSTLREEMALRRSKGDRFNMRTIVAMMVPLISDLAERHANGETFFIHPSSIEYNPAGARILDEYAQSMPTDPKDKACLAPEQRNGQAGDARASVFAIGAVLYELATGKTVGPGMRRPSELAPGMSQNFENLISKALVAGRAARPADLGALAQALHHCAPMASLPPPPADESHLDHDEGFDVDVSLSMIPPPPTGPAVQALPPPPATPSGPGFVVPAGPASTAGPVSSSGSSTTLRLADLKGALESDPRPRYVVIKDGMDHGPFTAVELLQQIAQSQFRIENFLRDTLSTEERPIAEWEQFAPFAHQAGLHREVQKERKALDASVTKERHALQNKAAIGIAILAVGLAGVGGWWFKFRGSDDVRIGVTADEAQLIDFDDGLGSEKDGPAGKQGGGRWAGTKPQSGDGDSERRGPPPGGYPTLGGGMSCESARNAYVEHYGGSDVPPDLSAGAYGSVLNRGTYLNSCGVPPSTAVSICAAVQNGRAVGVTVRTNPTNGGLNSCLRGAVFGLSFPAHPRLDITSTVFKAQ
jgi:hypothetical protein